jgi:hypothetical protein
MASSGSGKKEDRDGSRGSDGGAKESVADLLLKLNLTEAEEVVLEFSDDDGGAEPPVVEWALVGKVLSPSIVHVATVRSAMKPAWGESQRPEVSSDRRED